MRLILLRVGIAAGVALIAGPALSQQPFVYKCERDNGKPYVTTDERDVRRMMKCKLLTRQLPKAPDSATQQKMHGQHMAAVEKCMEDLTEASLIRGERDRSKIAADLTNNCGSAYRAFAKREGLMSDESVNGYLEALADKQVAAIRRVVIVPQ